MDTTRIRAFLLAAIIAVAAFAYCSASLNGGGSTFIYPVFKKWVDAYSRLAPDLRINYEPVGSLQGVDSLLTHSVAFAASDAPLHLEQMNEPSCGTLYFPTVVGAVVVAYNLQLPSTSRIRLTGQVLGEIYLGKVQYWNDPAIIALNPGIVMPKQKILVGYRSDGSGTTFTFTEYLTKVNAEWAKRVGAGMLAEWPAGLPAKGNEGVSEMVKNQGGAIGYIELSYAIAKGIPFALLQNRASNWVDASSDTISAAAVSLSNEMPSDLQQSITDAPGQSAYPISSYSYLLLLKQQTDSATVQSFSKFADWILHDGQAYATALHYAPVPNSVRERAVDQVKQIEVVARTATRSCKTNLGLAKGSGGAPVRINPETAGPLFSD